MDSAFRTTFPATVAVFDDDQSVAHVDEQTEEWDESCWVRKVQIACQLDPITTCTVHLPKCMMLSIVQHMY